MYAQYDIINWKNIHTLYVCIFRLNEFTLSYTSNGSYTKSLLVSHNNSITDLVLFICFTVISEVLALQSAVKTGIRDCLKEFTVYKTKREEMYTQSGQSDTLKVHIPGMEMCSGHFSAALAAPGYKSQVVWIQRAQSNPCIMSHYPYFFTVLLKWLSVFLVLHPLCIRIQNIQKPHDRTK